MTDPSRNEPLKRRTILDGHCRMLIPKKITNSGKSDGGWMDRVGITEAGFGQIFEPPNAMGPFDAFYSNDAWARPGFATLEIALYPPLETIGEPSTRSNLTDFVLNAVRDVENAEYHRGNYTDRDAPRIDHPGLTLNSTANLIVQYWYEVPVVVTSPYLPPDLTTIKQVALLSFAGRGMVLIRANNLETHDPPVDYNQLLASVEFVGSRPYLGPDPNLSGLQGLSMYLRNGNQSQAMAAINREREKQKTMEAPRLCFRCSAASSSGGGKLLQCSRCHVATYCGGTCQSKDWKRHKQDECLPKST